MSRKDYIKLAQALRASRVSHTMPALRKASDHQLDCCIEAVADVLQADNSRFDRRRFYEAAGSEERLNEGANVNSMVNKIAADIARKRA